MLSGARKSPKRNLKTCLMSLAVLKAISKKPLYGYALVEVLKGIFNQDVPKALVYVTLKRLEEKGLVRSKLEVSNRGPARRIYFLTEDGMLVLQRKLEEAARFVELVEKIKAY